MHTSIRTALAVLCSLGLSAGALAQGSQAGATAGTGGSGSAAAQQIGNLPVPRDAQELLKQLHQGNQKEIKLAQLAQQKAQSKEVKDLAQKILTDHQQADLQVQQLAQQMKVSLGTPKESGNIHKKYQTLANDYQEALTAVQGQPFDQLYATDMVLDHDKDVATLAASKQYLTSSPQVAQLVDQLLPKLDQHRQMALDALKAVQPNPQLGVGGAGK